MIIEVEEKYLENYGVYKITNLVTGDFYIGSTIKSFKARLASHKSSKLRSDKNTYIIPLLQEAFENYNISNFKFEILLRFSAEKSKEQKLKVVRYLEERFINRLSPLYNICKKPTLSGCPNLNRKLSEEWKKNISIKSKLYKHVGENYKKVCRKNKENACVYRLIYPDGRVFEGSLIECSKHHGVVSESINKMSKGLQKVRGLEKVEKIKSQTKKLKLFTNEGEVVFDSFSACDKYLDKWRGYTSTHVTRGSSTLCDFKYQIL